MPKKYGLKVTDLGRSLIAQSISDNASLQITAVAIGDGDGGEVEVNSSTERLVNEVFRTIPEYIEKVNGDKIHIQAVIPSNKGGFTVREVGIYSIDTLIAYGNFPATVKPLMDDGTDSELLIDLYLAIDNHDKITVVAPNNIYATREQAIGMTQKCRAVDPHLMWESIDYNAHRIQAILSYEDVGTKVSAFTSYDLPREYKLADGISVAYFDEYPQLKERWEKGELNQNIFTAVTEGGRTGLRMPNYGGYFLRGITPTQTADGARRDAGNGIDGVEQGDAIRNIVGKTGIEAPLGQGIVDGAFIETDVRENAKIFANNSSKPLLAFDASKGIVGDNGQNDPTKVSNENRPKNKVVAYAIYCGVTTDVHYVKPPQSVIHEITEATQTTAGVIKIATESEVAAGVDNRKAVTAQMLDKKLKNNFVLIEPKDAQGNPLLIYANNRLILDNPFGGNYVSCIPEVFYNGKWGNPEWHDVETNANYVRGVKANQLGDKIILQSGNHRNILMASNIQGNPFGITATTVLVDQGLPYRVKVWRIG